MSTEPTIEPTEVATPRTRLRRDTTLRTIIVELFDAPRLPLPTQNYNPATPRSMGVTRVEFTVRALGRRALLQSDDPWALVDVTAHGTRLYDGDDTLIGHYPYDFTWSSLTAAPVPAWLADVVREWLPAHTDAARVLGGVSTP